MSSTATHTAKCTRCHRVLTSAASVARGYGRTCGAKILAAAAVIDLTVFKDPEAARTKAVELLEQGALIPTSRTDQYLAVSSDGTDKYLVDSAELSCTCKAGVRLGRCSHLTAAHIVTLSRTVPARVELLLAA